MGERGPQSAKQVNGLRSDEQDDNDVQIILMMGTDVLAFWL